MGEGCIRSNFRDFQPPYNPSPNLNVTKDRRSGLLFVCFTYTIVICLQGVLRDSFRSTNDDRPQRGSSIIIPNVRTEFKDPIKSMK